MAYYNTLGADGENWNAWGKDVFNGSINLFGQAFTAWANAKYGNQTLQQVQQNPNTDSSQSILREFMQWQMMQNNNRQQLPQQQQKDNTMLYVALGIGALALIMMMNNNDSRRR